VGLSHPAKVELAEAFSLMKQTLTDWGVFQAGPPIWWKDPVQWVWHTDRPLNLDMWLRERFGEWSAKGNFKEMAGGKGVGDWYPVNIRNSTGAELYLFVWLKAKVGPVIGDPWDRPDLTIMNRIQDVMRDTRLSDTDRVLLEEFVQRYHYTNYDHNARPGLDLGLTLGQGDRRIQAIIEQVRTYLRLALGGDGKAAAEFTHRVDYDLYMGLTTLPPPAIQALLFPARKLADGVGAMVGHGTVQRFRDQVFHRSLDTSSPAYKGTRPAGTATLYSPRHLAVKRDHARQPPPEPAYDRARWAEEPGALPEDKFLRGDALARLAQEIHPVWAPLDSAAIRYTPVTMVSRGQRPAAPRPLWDVPGFADNLPGFNIAAETGGRMLVAEVRKLLTEGYKTSSGPALRFLISKAERLPLDQVATFKPRVYSQHETVTIGLRERLAQKQTLENFVFGDDQGQTDDGPQHGYFEQTTAGSGGGLDMTREINKEGDNLDYHYYRLSGVLVIEGQHKLYVEVPDGYWGALPKVLGEQLEAAEPRIFIDPALVASREAALDATAAAEGAGQAAQNAVAETTRQAKAAQDLRADAGALQTEAEAAERERKKAATLTGQREQALRQAQEEARRARSSVETVADKVRRAAGELREAARPAGEGSASEPPPDTSHVAEIRPVLLQRSQQALQAAERERDAAYLNAQDLAHARSAAALAASVAAARALADAEQDLTDAVQRHELVQEALTRAETAPATALIKALDAVATAHEEAHQTAGKLADAVARIASATKELATARRAEQELTKAARDLAGRSAQADATARRAEGERDKAREAEQAAATTAAQKDREAKAAHQAATAKEREVAAALAAKEDAAALREHQEKAAEQKAMAALKERQAEQEAATIAAQKREEAATVAAQEHEDAAPQRAAATALARLEAERAAARPEAEQRKERLAEAARARARRAAREHHEAADAAQARQRAYDTAREQAGRAQDELDLAQDEARRTSWAAWLLTDQARVALDDTYLTDQLAELRNSAQTLPEQEQQAAGQLREAERRLAEAEAAVLDVAGARGERALAQAEQLHRDLELARQAIAPAREAQRQAADAVTQHRAAPTRKLITALEAFERAQRNLRQAQVRRDTTRASEERALRELTPAREAEEKRARIAEATASQAEEATAAAGQTPDTVREQQEATQKRMEQRAADRWPAFRAQRQAERDKAEQEQAAADALQDALTVPLPPPDGDEDLEAVLEAVLEDALEDALTVPLPDSDEEAAPAADSPAAIRGILDRRLRGTGLGALLGRPPAVPDMLRGFRFSQLHAARRAAFFSAIDMASGSAPARADLDPARLGTGPVSEGVRASRTSAPPVPGMPRPRKAQRVPHLNHSVWLGGPLHQDGGDREAFMRRLASTARLGTRFEFVLWTDVTRADFDAVRGVPGPAALTGRPRQVREMLDWAQRHGIRLVNVDEVFSAEQPGRLDRPVRIERSRASSHGYRAASYLLRVDILNRFGGVYGQSMPDFESAADTAADTRDGLAISRDPSGARSVTGLAAAAGSAGIRAHLDELEERYSMPFSRLPAGARSGPSGEIAVRMGSADAIFDGIARRLGHTAGASQQRGRDRLATIPRQVRSPGAPSARPVPGQPTGGPADEAVARAVAGAVLALHRELEARPGGFYAPAAALTIEEQLPAPLREQAWLLTVEYFHRTLGGRPLTSFSAPDVEVPAPALNLVNSLFPGLHQPGDGAEPEPARRPRAIGWNVRVPAGSGSATSPG
jgi:hypothetical protein